MNESPEKKKAWIYAFSSQFLWGTGGVAIKLIDSVLPGSLLISIRHGIGALVLGTSALVSRKNIFKDLPWIHLIILGVVAAGLTDLLFVQSVRYAGAIITTILARIEIPLGVIFAHLFLKEKVGKAAYLAAILSLVGAALISLKDGITGIDFGGTFYLGVLFGLMTAFLWAGSGVYAKFILSKKSVDPTALSFVRLSIGALFNILIVIFLIKNPLPILSNLSGIDWGLIIYLGIFLSGLAYLGFYKALKILDAHVLSVLMSVSLVTTLALGLAIGEKINPVQWLGIALVIVSVVLIQRNSKKS